jgi:hypothetical protein
MCGSAGLARHVAWEEFASAEAATLLHIRTQVGWLFRRNQNNRYFYLSSPHSRLTYVFWLPTLLDFVFTSSAPPFPYSRKYDTAFKVPENVWLFYVVCG